MARFSAVVTTGIYCRPGCVARPHPGNVRPFDLAAAAEAAGYRPCLRCRPYRTPLPLPPSAPELVCRAVQLVVTGALDGDTEATLARRLGVSARHLRRLFTAHLGVTPDQLARSRRVHFARRLLDDTDLSITDIAFAAGFGSVRQLNRACLEVFGAPPTALRARRHRADRLVADGGLDLRLPYHAALDWPATLAFLARRAIPGVEHVSAGTYRRTILVDGHPGVIELRRGAGAEDHLLLRCHLPHWEGLIHVAERARRIPNLDVDVDAATSLLARDPVLAPLVQTRPGLRVPGTWDGFETGVRAIVGQQVSVAAATTIAGRIARALGEPVAGLGQLGLSHTFPAPARFAEAGQIALGGVGLPRARAAAVLAFATAVAGGEVVLDGSQPLEELVAALTRLPGIGPWTAHYLAMRLGEHDAFPGSDLALRRALVRTCGTDEASRAEAWRPWRALAAFHIWSHDYGTSAPSTKALAAVTGHDGGSST